MRERQHVWALVLAAGDGSRLRALTTGPCGTAVPKQFCSLHGGRSLLEDALWRAAQAVAPERICTIVAQQHRQWWAESRPLNELPSANLIAQPRNRGTAIGILFSLLHILARDPLARIVLLPADHYVREESVLRDALAAALARVGGRDERAILLGVEPEEIDTELGYILPGEPDGRGGRSVARFIEKPSLARASEIVAAGGLWNTFILAAPAQALVNLFLPRNAALVMEMQIIVSRSLHAGLPTGGWPAILDLYERLPSLDFSRDLLEAQAARLCVHAVPSCGWSDLGTPRRVGETLRRLQMHGALRITPAITRSMHVSLADQHAQFERAGAGA